MSDIFKYKASLTIQHNRSDEIAKRLPAIFKQRLHDVVARDIEVKSSLVTFHGGASRTATKRDRLVTNWNLLHGVSRGAIQIKNSYPTLTIVLWLGYAKVGWIYLLPFIGFIAAIGISLFLAGEPLLNILLGLLMPIIGLFFISDRIGRTLASVRFHWFMKSCVNQATREVEKQLSGSIP